MKPIRIGSAMRIEIGYDGENGARQIVFDATKWMDELPGCTAAITAVRADGEPYIAPNVTQDEEKKTITWTLTSAETMEGEGRAQLLWMDGERIAKQAIFTTVCHESLQNDATEIDVPEPVWAQQSLAAAKAAKASAEAAAASEEGAKAALEETKGVRDNAKTEIDEKKASAIDGINNAKAEAIASIDAEKDELAPPIICTTSGTVITMTDSADRPLRGLTVFGRTEQDGVPSEDAPAALDSVGSKGSVELTVARGLPDTIVIIKQPRHLAGAVGDTVIFEVIALGYGLTYQWQWKGSSAWDNTGLEGNKTASLIVPVTQSRNGNRYRCVIKDANGHTVTTKDASLTVGDVAESDDAADDTQTATISTEEGLRGVPVMSGTGTYTDADGQGWIADTVEYDAQTGTAKIVRRVGMVMYDGSVDEEWAKSSEKGLFSILINGCSQTSHGICTHYEVGDIVADQGAYGFSAGAWPGLIVVRPADYADLTVDAWRARLNASPVTVLYALANPVVTALSTDELAEMSALRSRYPATTVLSDDGAHMEVQYIADTKKYVDDADTEMAKAIMAVDARVDAAIEQTADVGGRADAAQKKADENENEIGKLKGDIADCVNGLSNKTKSIRIEWELGYITSAGVEGTSNTSARTKDILHISKGDIVRCNSEGYKSINVFLYNPDGSFDYHSYWTSVFGNINEDITVANDMYCRFSSGLITGDVITDPTSQMQNVFILNQAYGYLRVDYLEQEAEKTKDNPQRIVALEHDVELLQKSSAIIVAKDGSGDFTTIQDAVDFARDDDTILVMPGVYEEMVTTKIDVAPYQKYVHIKGYDKYRCILQTHTNERLLDPLTMSIGSVSNMTIKNLYDESQPHEERGGYCIHVDLNVGTDEKRSKYVLENCIFYSENGDCLGCGLWDNWILEVRNCVLESAEISSKRCFAIHNTMSESSCKVILDGNRIIKHGQCLIGKIVSFTDVRNGQPYNSIIEVYAHNNTVYDFYNDTSDSVYVGTTSVEKGWDNQNQFLKSKESYGNNTALLN